MTKHVLVVLVGLLLSVGLVGPAEAAGRHVPPSAPRDVVATAAGQDPGSVRVSWRRPKHSGTGPVRSYVVTYAEASAPSDQQRVVVAADRRATVLHGLAAGQRYVVRVAAVNRWGRGPWARTRVDVPAPTHQEALFAVDEGAHTLVRFATSGPPDATTVLTGVTGASDLEVDRAGNAYVAADGTVTEVPVSGAPRVLGAGTQVETDAAGNVYLGSSAGVVELGPDGRRTVVTTDGAGTNLAVDAAGTVTVATEGYGASVTTYAPGAEPVHHDLTTLVKGGRILADSRGTVYDDANSGGGAGFDYWVRIASPTADPVQLGTRSAEYGATVAPDDSFYLAETVSFCPDTSENTGSCTPDRHVSTVARYAPDGHLVSAVPTSGFSTRRYLGVDVAADSTGTLFAADRGVGETPALVRVAPAGGAATRVAAGEFGLLAVG